MGANEALGMANLDPKGMVGMIYVGDYLTLLHTLCFIDDDFLSFPHYKSMEANKPNSMAYLDPEA
ncbi:MAG: hypothetical protein N0E48_10600 [Candidatus Thiodiazotropha endolucinida]|nr:hypothetical protein [Candidatus Thiodiazotropha taylori]MCW4343793.1 hypothetical protein [Candidatus Thiodiazotropha endolucinida]